MGRIALVTGGTRGIGAAIAKTLKDHGHTVAATYAGNARAAEEFKTATGIPVYRWNVADPVECADGVETVERDLGPIDILVNNAGITRDGMFHRMSHEVWSDVMRVNLDSMFTMTRPVIEGMRARNFGRIINVSSINGQKGQVGQVNYCTAKAGVIGFTKALALENARKGITVNCLCPGYIDTDMVSAVSDDVMKGIVAQIPVGRLGKAEEIADMVGFLASDRAGFVTGATISVNGGQHLA